MRVPFAGNRWRWAAAMAAMSVGPLAALALAASVNVSAAEARASFIYVDPINGRDSNPGTRNKPYKTLQKGLKKVQPGWTIKLASGIYREANKTIRAGTPENPITIEPVDGAHPILDGNANSLNAIRIIHSYYIVRGLEIANTNQGVRLEGVTGVLLENNHIHHVNRECLRLRYYSVKNTVRNNTIHDCGLQGNGEGVYIGTATEQRYKNGGLPDPSVENHAIGNEIYNVTEGIDIKEDSSFTTVSNNFIHDSTDINSGGINIRSDENYLYGNRSYQNAGAGFRFGGDIAYSPSYGDDHHYGTNNLLRNNVSSDNARYGYKFMNGPQDADCSNTGSSNGVSLLTFGSGVARFVKCY